MATENLLAAAKRVWTDVSAQIKAADEPKEGTLLPVDELKKVSKYLQHTLTKFGASATAVADAEEAKKGLTPIAQEVVKAYTAAAGTLMSLSGGAGACLAAELKDAGSGLADSLEALGNAVLTPGLASCAAKALQAAGNFERVSTQNRAAIRRRLLKNLAMLRDANREMQQEIENADKKGLGTVEVLSGDEELLEDEDDLCSAFQETMLPSERRILESALKMSTQIEEVLKEASTSCVAGSESQISLDLATLEVIAEQATQVPGAIDTLAADCVGGVDAEACNSSLEKLRQALPVFIHYPSGAADTLTPLLEETQAALAAAEAEEAAKEDE